MSAGLRDWAKRLLPAGWRRALRRRFGWRWFEGDFPSWAAAQAVSGTYRADAILERVRRSTAAVRDGRAAFERDGVSFAEPATEPGLTAALRHIAAVSDGRLRLIDFGGALGTTYWRHRAALSDLAEVAWDVVEQAHFVALGRREFAGDTLRFFDSIAAAEAARPHELLLVSTTLQYLPDPFATLPTLLEPGWSWLLFNNLPLHADHPDRIAVQRVPPSLGGESYPVWFFNRDRFLQQLSPRYTIAAEYASEAVWPVDRRDYRSTGLLLKRKVAA